MKKKRAILLSIFVLCLVLFTSSVRANVVAYPEAANWPIDVKVAFTTKNQYTSSSYIFGGSGFELSFNYGGKSYSGFKAFCSDTIEGIPMNTPIDKVVEKAIIMSPGDTGYNKKLAMAVYYGYGGPGDLTVGLSEQHRISLTSFACSYAKNGDKWAGIIGTPTAQTVANDNAVFRQMKAHIDSCDGPDDIQYLYAATYEIKPEGGGQGWITAAIENNYGIYGCQYYQFLTAYWGKAPMGKIKLSKTLDTYDSSYATVSGAEYSVYSDSNCSTKVGTLITGADGNTNTIDVVAGTYYVKETKAPEGCRIDETKYTINVTSGNTTFVRSNEKVKYQIRIRKTLQDINECYGDAKLETAKYGIYTTADCSGNPVAILTTNNQGVTEVSNYLDYKTYYAKEIKAPVGTVLNSTIYTLDPSRAVKEGQDYVATFDTKNEIIRTTLKIIKYEDNIHSSDENPAEGAVLRLTLNSNENETYTQTIDEYGYCEFTDIPYGTYTLTEDTSGSDKYLLIDDEVIDMFLPSEEHNYRVITGETELEVFLRIRKYDKDTNQAIYLSGAKFKIYDVENNKFVSQMITPSGEFIDEFETNEEGIITTPQQLEAGKYVIYETQAPEGYYLNPKYKVPANSEDLGNPEKAGIGVNITTQLQVDVTDEDKYIYDINIENEPLKVKLEINKKGEMLTEVLTTTTEYGEKYTPKYTYQGLEGVTYEIYAAQDIKSPDGRITYVEQGAKVDTITTGEDGIATTKELYPGEYEIKEIVTPRGYLVDENIPNVVLSNTDSEVRVKTEKKELSDKRQKLEITFKKEFEDVKYQAGEDIEKKAIFAIYTNQVINNYKGNELIGKDSLVDLIEVEGENVDVTSTIDLPEGKYYVKEVYASYPYTKSEEIQEFNLQYNNNPRQEFIVIEGEKVVNTAETASITLIKLSTTTIKDLILKGDEIDTTNLDKEVSEILEDLKGKTEEEIKEYLEENEVKFVPGAKYNIYTDEKCLKPLKILDETTNEYKEAQIVTDNSGLIKLENVPLGEYWVKEVEAPKGYELSNEVVKVSLDLTNKNTMIYQALIENSLMSEFLTKTDIFTGEVVPNCTFEIKDENGNVLLHSITNDDGKAYIPISLFENGKKYTYTEIDAPKIYDLNTESHEFVAEFNEDGKWITKPIEVDNIRKKSTVTITKLDMVDSTPIPNCKFELKSLETDFKVEGVTDEDGIYVFENIPYGKYTYTELEAPEEYLIDTTPHEITIDAEDMKIVVKDERAPETGDIDVEKIVCISIVAIFGIVFVLKKNKKQIV